MSWLFAFIYDDFMRKSEAAGLAAWRAELLSSAFGAVVEVGAGTGLNLDHYPPAVERLVLAEPDRHMRRKLAARVRAAGRRAEVVPSSAESLPLDAGSCDFVVSTLVLCSVGDVARALAELRRVLRPGGALLFLEHVAAHDDSPRLRWQRRLEPFWCRLAGNCHLTRDTAREIERAGFVLERCERASMRKALPWVRPTVRGLARRTT